MAWEYVCGVFNVSILSTPFMYVGSKKTIIMVVIMLILEWVTRRKEHSLQYNKNNPSWVAWICSLVMVLIILEFGGNSQSFIYFQF